MPYQNAIPNRSHGPNVEHLAGVMATPRSAAIHHLLRRPSHLPYPLLRRPLSLWSSKKDPALESALSRNRRWIVNNQIKHILLRSPGRAATVRSLQSRFKTLDLQGRALNWLRKYPCCFDVFLPSAPSGEPSFRFSKRMAALVDEEAAALDASEPAMARRLAKLLMLSRHRRLNVVKLNELKRSLGLPDDYLLRLLPQHPDTFRLSNPPGRRTTMELELLRWDPALAVSAVEAASNPPLFACSLPPTWIKTIEKHNEFNHTPYVSPYSDDRVESEKRTVGVIHELLSLMLWKKASIKKLEHFRREFGLPEQLNLLLLRHPCIFYVSNRYQIYTVLLREGYRGAELIEKDPLVVVKDKFGELMQEGLHEYNKRRQLANIEKKRKRGEIAMRPKREEDEDEEAAAALDSKEKREERKRFYNVLFNDKP